jgi:hypothetical protein
MLLLQVRMGRRLIGRGDAGPLPREALQFIVQLAVQRPPRRIISGCAHTAEELYCRGGDLAPLQAAADGASRRHDQAVSRLWVWVAGRGAG